MCVCVCVCDGDRLVECVFGWLVVFLALRGAQNSNAHVCGRVGGIMLLVS